TAFAEALEVAEAAEAWGLDRVWLGEIHFNPWRSVQSAPMNLAAFMAARTTRVRIGMAVIVLPLAHPLRIAEEVATVDHLSQGRFDLGIGRSGGARTYDRLGVAYGESQARLEAYRVAWREAGHPGDGDVCLRIPVYAAPTEKEALEEPRENITYFFERHQELTRTRLGRNDTGPLDRHEARLAKLKAMDYDEI